MDSYLLVFAGLLLAAGTLGDRFGRKKAPFVGLTSSRRLDPRRAVDSSNELIASRALMGLGAAAIMPTTLSILTNIFPENERPKAIAAWAAVAGLGIAIGPISGGWLIEHFDWSSIFLVNLPILAVGLVAGAFLIPESRDPESPQLDLPGGGLSIAGLSALVWGLIEAPERGWTDTTILGAFAPRHRDPGRFHRLGARCKQPMLDVSVFRNLRFSAASLSVTLVFFALMGVMFFLTTYLQSVLGYSALEAGVRMLPVAVGLILRAPSSRSCSPRRFGTKIAVAAGLSIVAGGLWPAHRAFDVDTGYGRVAALCSLMGFGMGTRDVARDRGDHGLAAEGQGRHRLGDERRGPRGRRHARRRGARQRARPRATAPAWTPRRRASRTRRPRRRATPWAPPTRSPPARRRRGLRLAPPTRSFVDAHDHHGPSPRASPSRRPDRAGVPAHPGAYPGSLRFRRTALIREWR